MDDLIKSKRGRFNEPRNVAIYLTRRLRHDSLQEIGTQFQIKKYSSVSSIVERMKNRIDTDRKVKKRIDELCVLIKSQEQTPLFRLKGIFGKITSTMDDLPVSERYPEILEAISKKSFGPISVLDPSFNSSEYLSMPAGRNLDLP